MVDPHDHDLHLCLGQVPGQLKPAEVAEQEPSWWEQLFHPTSIFPLASAGSTGTREPQDSLINAETVSTLGS